MGRKEWGVVLPGAVDSAHPVMTPRDACGISAFISVIRGEFGFPFPPRSQRPPMKNALVEYTQSKLSKPRVGPALCPKSEVRMKNQEVQAPHPSSCCLYPLNSTPARAVEIKKAVGRQPLQFEITAPGRYVFMIFRPARRFLTRPLPPRDLAARFLAAVILPPLLFFAI